MHALHLFHLREQLYGELDVATVTKTLVDQPALPLEDEVALQHVPLGLRQMLFQDVSCNHVRAMHDPCPLIATRVPAGLFSAR